MELAAEDEVRRPGTYTVGVILVVGTVTFITGVWGLVSPSSFADFIDFPNHVHFLHDIGAFQIGLASMLALALIWRDAVAVALAAFLIANTIHMVNHFVDSHHGGGAAVPWLLGLLSLLTAGALRQRLGQLASSSSTRNSVHV